MPRLGNVPSTNMGDVRFPNDRVKQSEERKGSWKMLPDFSSPLPSEFPIKPRLGATPVDFRTPQGIESTPNIGARFHAFVASEPDDDCDETESESDASSAFTAGKRFWLQFLERRDSESQTSEEDSRNRKTPMGREINRTWSSGSSITEISAFHKQSNTPTAMGQSSGTPHSAASDDGTGSIRRKASVAGKWKSPRDSFPRQGSSLNKNPKRSFSFTMPPTPTQRGINGSTPVHRRSTPRAFGGDVTNLSSTPRAFGGDVTNIPGTPKQNTPSSRGNLIYKQSGLHRLPGSVENKITSNAPMNRFSGAPTQMLVHPTKPISKKENPGETSVRVNNDSTVSKTDFENLDEPASVDTNLNETFDKEAHEDSPPVDPIIELIPSSPASIPGALGKMEIVRVSPRADCKDRFQWAYDVWQKAGLMKKVPQKRGIATRISSGISTFQAKPLSPSADSTHLISPKKVKPPSATKQNLPSDSIPIKAITKKTVAANTHYTEIKQVPSGESDHSGFQNLLKKWRDKSDDKPNTHFLSPEQEAKAFETVASGPKDPHSWIRGVSKSISSPPAEGRTEEVTCNGIEYTKQELHKGQKDSFSRESALEDTSQAIRRSTTFGDEKPPTEYTRASRELVDSDKFEEEYTADDEECRALVILDSKEAYGVTVGETRMGSGQDLVIRNVELVQQDQETNLTEFAPCECSHSVFSGDDELISFYLPQMGMACTCGRPQRMVNPNEPTAIENVLRPWQVDFLRSFGITRGEQLVKARHRSADIMAKALRQWRKQKNMTYFKTQSCGMAIDIWAKTCKTYVRSIRKQIETGTELVERQPGIVLKELSQFLADLPAAPARRRAAPRIAIEPESQAEV